MDLDLKITVKSDPDPNQIVLDAQHCIDPYVSQFLIKMIIFSVKAGVLAAKCDALGNENQITFSLNPFSFSSCGSTDPDPFLFWRGSGSFLV